MITLLLLTDSHEDLAGLEAGFKNEHEIKIIWATKLTDAIDKLGNNNVDLMVVDKWVGGIASIDVVKKMIMNYPMTNYALVSDLNPDDFHEKSEGLGVLMQLPPKPDAKQGTLLLEKIKKVLSLTSKRNTKIEE